MDTAWKNLSKLEKKEYEEEVHKLKQKYIKEYEKYLKALTKEQLNAFWHLKRKKDEKAAATIKSENNDTQDEVTNFIKILLMLLCMYFNSPPILVIPSLIQLLNHQTLKIKKNNTTYFCYFPLF